MEQSRIRHGGDLDEARRIFPEAPEPWIDLSTGINPIPYPIPNLPPSLFHRLPSRALITEVEAAAGLAYGVEGDARVVASPGTQVLIGLLPRLRPRGRVAVLGPTYAEHVRAWRAAGHEVVNASSVDELTQGAVGVVVNPNNPDGRLLSRSDLISIARHFADTGGWLVVDEAFMDFGPDESLVPKLPPSAIVLRSFGKTYGLAGLRLGFAIAEPRIAADVSSALGPWAVSGHSAEIGCRALQDRPWLLAARAARSLDAAQLDAILSPFADGEICGTTLYRCIRNTGPQSLFRLLGARGIWVRSFEHDPSLLRFGLPANETAWERLRTALSSS